MGAASSSIDIANFPDKLKESISNFPREPVAIIQDSEIVQRLFLILEQFEMSKENSRLVLSICPEEINFNKDNFISTLTNGCSVNNIGGLAGCPFGGKTALKQIMNQAPKKNILLIFASHISIDEKGNEGIYELPGGQIEDIKHSCYTQYKAYQELNANSKIVDDPYDPQMTWIKKRLQKYVPLVTKSDNPYNHLSLSFFEILKDFILNIVETNDDDIKIAVLGGIHVNTPQGYQDCFLPMYFSVHENKKKVTDQLLCLSDAYDADRLKPISSKSVEQYKETHAKIKKQKTIIK